MDKARLPEPQSFGSDLRPSEMMLQPISRCHGESLKALVTFPPRRTFNEKAQRRTGVLTANRTTQAN